jgi:predicted HicB family RNase H-like nuclease
MLTYKGYTGIVEFDADAEIFHGEVIDTSDVITFQGKNAKEIKKAFRDSIDDYLDFCEELQKAPDKPFSGKFVLRVSPQLHHKLYKQSMVSKKSLNAWLVEKLESLSL